MNFFFDEIYGNEETTEKATSCTEKYIFWVAIESSDLIEIKIKSIE